MTDILLGYYMSTAATSDHDISKGIIELGHFERESFYILASIKKIINLGLSADRLVRHYFPFKVLFRHSPLPLEFHTSVIILEIVKQFLI